MISADSFSIHDGFSVDGLSIDGVSVDGLSINDAFMINDDLPIDGLSVDDLSLIMKLFMDDGPSHLSMTITSQ